MGASQRDDGLRRISSVTRWVAAGGIVMAGFLAAAVAKAAPGRGSSPSSPASSPTGQPASSPATSPSGDQSQLQQPSSSVDPATTVVTPPPVVPSYSRHHGYVSSGGS